MNRFLFLDIDGVLAGDKDWGKDSQMAPVASTRGLYEHLHEFLRKYPTYSSLSPLRGVRERQ